MDPGARFDRPSDGPPQPCESRYLTCRENRFLETSISKQEDQTEENKNKEETWNVHLS
jgi:hypothetical protein